MSGAAAMYGVMTATVLAALTLAVWRPMTPWWLHADPDATYLGSAVNLLLGYPNEHHDHPGVPLHTVLVLTLSADHAIQWLLHGTPASVYADALLSDPAAALWMVRAWAIVFFLFGVVAAFEIGRRTLHQTWAGPAAVAMYLACPGHLAMADTFRPVNLLSGLCLIVTYFLATSSRDESARPGRARPRPAVAPVRTLLIALVLFGLTISVKIHALGLAAAVVLACFIRRRSDWIVPLQVGVRGFLARRWWPVFPFAVLALMALTHHRRDWTNVDTRALVGIAILCVWGGVCVGVRRRWTNRTGTTAAAWDEARPQGAADGPSAAVRPRRRSEILRRWAHPMPPIAAAAVLLGLLAPFAFFVDECVPTLRTLWWALIGPFRDRPVNATAVPAAVIQLWHDPRLWMGWPIAALAALGFLQGWRGRGREGVVWLLAVGGMFALAMARTATHASPHHYGAPMALLIPSALLGTKRFGEWADSRARMGDSGATSPRFRAAAKRARAGGVLALLALPIVRGQLEAWENGDRCDTLARVTATLTSDLDRGAYVMCDFWARDADAAHFTQVRDYCYYTPPRRYRSLPDTPTAQRYADKNGLRPAYYVTFGDRFTRISATGDGSVLARSAWGDEWWVEACPLPVVTDLAIRTYRILGAR